MPSPTRDQLIERFYLLPEKIQGAVSSVASAEKQNEVGKKHGLAGERMAALGSEIGLLLLGFTHPKNFTANLISRLALTAEQTKRLVDDIYQGVLLPVENELKDIHNIMSGPLFPGTAPVRDTLSREMGDRGKTIWNTLTKTTKNSETLPTKPKSIWDTIQNY